MQNAKKNSTNNPQFISPLMDLNKKDKAKLNSSPTKFKIILKKDNKTQIRKLIKINLINEFLRLN